MDDAAEWYERRREGLGQQFYDRVGEAVDKIEINPEGFRKIHRELRRCSLEQFTDWALWYKILPDHSIVVACLSGRTNPTLAKERAAGVIPMPKPTEPSS